MREHPSRRESLRIAIRRSVLSDLTPVLRDVAASHMTAVLPDRETIRRSFLV